MKKLYTLLFSILFVATFAQTFILPSTGVQNTYSGGCPVGTCSGTLLDPGGAGNYPNNVNQIYQVFCPTTPGTCIQATFTSFNTELGYDFLTIGNGPAQNSAVFTGAPANASGQIWGTPTVPFSYTANNSSGCLTFRFNSDATVNRPGFTASLSCVPCGAAQPAGNSDACAASFICSNLGFNDVSYGPGLNPTEGCAGSSCVTGETYSNWYTFSAATSGSLTFTINPNTGSDDFDYAIFGPNVSCGALGNPLRCSYAANTGNTGLGNGALDTSEDVTGNGWTSPMTVTAGQTYMLMINNWTAGGAGFNILFGGTATLGVLAPAVSSTSICAGQSAVLTATPATPGGTYTWSPGGANTQSISVSPGSTTSYSVVYAQGGCTSPASALATVTVNSVPTANAGTTKTITCANPTATLTGSGGGSYAWNGPGIVSGGTSANPVVNAPGTYSLNVTSPQGCTSSVATVAISQNTTTPSPTANHTGTLTCSNGTVALTGSPSSGVTYQWSGPGFSGGTTSQNAIATAPGTYTLRVTDAVNGCTATAVTTVTQNTATPVVTGASTATLTCASNTLNLNATTAATPVSYNWNGPGIVSRVGTGTITINQPGTYNYTVTNTSNGCVTTGTRSVTQNTTAPVVNGSVTGTLSCVNNTVNITATTAASPVNYSWNGPGIVSGSSTGTITVNQPGTYNYTVTNISNGCFTTGSQTVTQSAGLPVVNASTSGTLSCTTTSLTVSATTTSSPVSYNWNGPGIVSGTGTGTITVNQPGTYNYTVTNTSNGCSTTGSQAVSSNTTVVNANASSSGSITCATNNVTLTATPTGTNFNYSWTGPGTITNGTTDSPSVDAGGNYVVTVTNSTNGCFDTFTISVSTNTTVPILSLAANSLTTTCTTSTVMLNASSNTDPNSAYSWTVSSGGSLSSTTVNNPTALSGGIYDVVVTNTVNGCVSSMQTVTVTADANIPTYTLSATDVTLTCISSSETVTLTTTPTPLNYTWSPSPASGVNSTIPTFNTAGVYTCVITNTVNNCSTTAQVTVSSNTTIPSVTISGTQTLTCASPTAAITLTTTPASGLTYNWTGGTIVSGQGTDNITVNQAGNYTVTVTDAVNGCTTTANTQIFADTNVPSASVSASTNSIITCVNNTVTLTATVTPSATYSYTWSPSGNTSVSENVTSAGIYTVTVLNASTGCTATAQFTVTNNITAPNVTSSNTTTPCGSPSVTLLASSTNTNVSYSWSASSGTILSGSNTANPIAGGAGQYVVTVTDNDNGCTNSQTITVTTTSITSSFSVDPTSGSAPLTVNFTDQSSGTGNTYSWNFGDDNNNTSSSANPSHVYNTTGDYTVTLTVTDASGSCSSTSTVVINVFDNASITVPNVFTPNGDSKNDVFKIITTGIEELHCDIFNRWGTKVASLEGTNAIWDGNNAKDGTYFFILTAKGYDDKEYKQQGYINLFR